jgi:hypothetical protein
VLQWLQYGATALCSITTLWVLVFCGVCCGRSVVSSGDKRCTVLCLQWLQNGTEWLRYCSTLQQYSMRVLCSWRVCAVFGGVAMIYLTRGTLV